MLGNQHPVQEPSIDYDAAHQTQRLEFDTDRGSWVSTLIALLLLLGIGAWMASGYILPSEDEAETAEEAPASRLVNVATVQSSAQEIIQLFVAEGQALPDRESVLRAEISGKIIQVFVEKGETLEANQLVARFDGDISDAELERADENLRVAQREFNNAQALRERGAATSDRVSAARAALVAAQTELRQVGEDIENTVIKAPFAGRLDALDIDAGEFVSAGSDVGRIIDTSPLTIVIQVPQRALGNLQIGQQAQVAFITGQEVMGTVVFIGGNADEQTRTFRAEIEVTNTENTIPAGLSAQVRVPTGRAQAHFVSPAILSLGTAGELGVKAVDEQNRVTFYEVAIERAESDGIWVSGLPDQAQIITIGQAYVSDGEEVVAQPDTNLAGDAS